MMNDRRRTKRPATLKTISEMRTEYHNQRRAALEVVDRALQKQAAVETIYLPDDPSLPKEQLCETWSVDPETGELRCLGPTAGLGAHDHIDPQADICIKPIKQQRKSRVSPRAYLTVQQMVKTHDAIEYANSAGYLMNVSVTFVPKYIGASSEVEFNCFYKLFIKRFDAICERWGIDPVYVSVLEMSINRGMHAHIVMSIPVYFRFEFEYWLNETGKTLSENDIYSSKVFHCEFREPDVKRQWIFWRYMVKSLDPRATYKNYVSGRRIRVGRVKDLIGLTKAHSGVPFESQRVRISRSISASKQRTGKYVSKWQHREKLPSDWGSSAVWAGFLAEQQSSNIYLPTECRQHQPKWEIVTLTGETSTIANGFADYRGTIADLNSETFGGLFRAINNRG